MRAGDIVCLGTVGIEDSMYGSGLRIVCLGKGERLRIACMVQCWG